MRDTIEKQLITRTLNLASWLSKLTHKTLNCDFKSFFASLLILFLWLMPGTFLVNGLFTALNSKDNVTKYVLLIFR